jgi:hypothetical protein
MLLDPCAMEKTATRRTYCWSSYGRDLHIVLPNLAWNVIGVFRPRTFYTYKSVDLRFPPSVRVRLPFEDSSTTFGYDDEMVGWKLDWRF